jgi:hypothetical protein
MKILGIVMILCGVILTSCQLNVTDSRVIESENGTITPKTSPTPIASAIPKPKDQFDIYSKIGNVEVGNNCIRLIIENSQLKIGDRVQIVFTELPSQKIEEAQIIESTECKDDYFGDLTGNNPKAKSTHYLLKLLDQNAYLTGFGIGIVNVDKKVKIEKGSATIDLDEDKENEYFRECSSNEGLHLTVWKGKPLIGKRIWHSYYHFNYDTDPTCKKKDYEGTDD